MSSEITPERSEAATETPSNSTETSPQFSDIGSLRPEDFEDVGCEEDSQGSRKKSSPKYYDWIFVSNREEKTDILTNQHKKFRWLYPTTNGSVLRCTFHLNCPFKVKIVAPDLRKLSCI